MSQQGVTVISSIARGDYAIRKVLQQYGGKKIYIVHTPIDIIVDEQMKIDITRNINRVRDFYDMEELIVDLYDFYGNVVKFNDLIGGISGKIIVDLTGGDKCVSDALLYSCLLSQRTDITLLYVKRPEHVIPGSPSIVQFPLIPCLSSRQREFMEKLGPGKSIDEIATLLKTSKSNTWNIANALRDLGVVIIEKGDSRVVPSFPGNIYIKRTE